MIMETFLLIYSNRNPIDKRYIQNLFAKVQDSAHNISRNYYCYLFYIHTNVVRKTD